MFNYCILDLRVYEYVRIFVWCYASNMAYTFGWLTTQVRTVVDMKIFTQMHKRAHAMHVTCALRHKIAWRHLTLVAIYSLQRIWHLNTDMAQNKRGNCTRHETRKFTNHYVHDSHLVGRSFVRLKCSDATCFASRRLQTELSSYYCVLHSVYVEYNTPFNVTYLAAAAAAVAVKNYTGLDLGNFTGYLLEYIKLMLPEWNMSRK